MARPAVETARNQVLSLLKDTLAAAEALTAVLADERSALEAEERRALLAAVERKSSCIDRMRDLDVRRAELCVAFGFADNSRPMDDLIDWCDADGSIRSAWNRLLSKAADGASINLTNGAIIRARRQHFESGLNMLRGTTPGMDTYGHDGNAPGDFGHRALAEA